MQRSTGSRTHLVGARQGEMPTRAVPAPGRPISTKPPPGWRGRDCGRSLQATVGLCTVQLCSPCSRQQAGVNPASQW